MHENAIGTIVVDGAVELHRDLGPGLLETVYEVTLARGLERRGLRVKRQVAVAIWGSGSGASVPRCLRERTIHRTSGWRERGVSALVSVDSRWLRVPQPER